MDCCFLRVGQPLSNKALVLEANWHISSPSSSSNIVYVMSVSIALCSDVSLASSPALRHLYHRHYHICHHHHFL